MSTSYLDSSSPTTPSARCLRVMKALFSNPTPSTWNDFRNDPTVFEVDLRGKYQRIAVELRPFLIQVRNHGAWQCSNGLLQQHKAAYRFTPAALALLTADAPQSLPAALPEVPAQEDGVETWTITTLCGTHTYVSHEGGRWVGQGNGPQNMRGSERRALFAGCPDVDVVSCHPSLLLQFLVQHGVDVSVFDAVSSFAENIGSWREHTMKAYSLPLKAEQGPSAKQLLLALQYGMSDSGHTLMEMTAGRALTPALQELHDQMATVMKLIRKLTPEFKAIAQRTKTRQLTKEGTRLSKQMFFAAVDRAWPALVIQAEERKVFDACRSFVEKSGGRILVPMHDGFIPSISIDLVALAAHVHTATGYKLTFTKK